MDALFQTRLLAMFKELPKINQLDIPNRYDDIILKQLTDDDKAKLVKDMPQPAPFEGAFSPVETDDQLRDRNWFLYHVRMLTLRLMWFTSHGNLIEYAAL